MTKNVRIIVGVGLVVALLALVLVGDMVRRNQLAAGVGTDDDTSEVVTDGDEDANRGNGGGNGRGNGGGQGNANATAGAIPIYVDGERIGQITADSLDALEEASFVDAEEGQTQRGWLLRDIMPTLMDTDDLSADTIFVIQSSARDKSAELTWEQIDTASNNVLFDLSGRGTLKLVSETIETLDTRDEWVQDVDRIDITRPDSD